MKFPQTVRFRRIEAKICGKSPNYPFYRLAYYVAGKRCVRHFAEYETETIAALRAAEADKSAFCLENDAFGSGLLSFLSVKGPFNGNAKTLAYQLSDSDFWTGDLNAKSVGKRLVSLWPHLEKVLAVAKREKDRNGVMTFNLKRA